MAKSDSVPAIAGLTFEQLSECLRLGATLEQVRELAEGGFGFEQITQLSVTLGQARGSGGGISPSDLKQILVDQRKAMKPENEMHPGISAFSYPEGEQKRPKPQLRRETYFNGVHEKWDSLTPMEVELYNRFDRSMTAKGGNWKADVRKDGSSELLWIETFPKTLDGRQSLPPLHLLLRELLDGAAAVDPVSMATRVAELEARIKALTPAVA